MKLLVSDYDDTLYTTYKNLYLNIKAIKDFRKKGNMFAIATSRSYASIKNEISKFSIPIDYLICFEGNLIMDNQDNILFENCISDDDFQLISTINQDAISEKVNGYDNQGIIELVHKFDSGFDAKEHKKAIEQLMPTVKCYKHFSTLYTTNRFDKSIGIDLLLNFTGIDENDVYTVGDDMNDLQMLQLYNGHKMLSCNPLLYFSGVEKTCTQVHQLIKRISN